MISKGNEKLEKEVALELGKQTSDGPLTPEKQQARGG